MIDDVIGTSSSPTTLNSISKLLNPKFISPAQPPLRTHISNYLMSPRCLKGISNPIWLGELLIVLPTASHFTTIHPVPWPQTYESSLSFPPPHTSISLQVLLILPPNRSGIYPLLSISLTVCLGAWDKVDVQ